MLKKRHTHKRGKKHKFIYQNYRTCKGPTRIVPSPLYKLDIVRCRCIRCVPYLGLLSEFRLTQPTGTHPEPTGEWCTNGDPGTTSPRF